MENYEVRASVILIITADSAADAQEAAENVLNEVAFTVNIDEVL